MRSLAENSWQPRWQYQDPGPSSAAVTSWRRTQVHHMGLDELEYLLQIFTSSVEYRLCRGQLTPEGFKLPNELKKLGLFDLAIEQKR